MIAGLGIDGRLQKTVEIEGIYKRIIERDLRVLKCLG